MEWFNRLKPLHYFDLINLNVLSVFGKAKTVIFSEIPILSLFKNALKNKFDQG